VLLKIYDTDLNSKVSRIESRAAVFGKLVFYISIFVEI